jgi:hypothetical protein
MALSESTAAELRLAQTGAAEALKRLAAILLDLSVDQFKEVDEAVHAEVGQLSAIIRRVAQTPS